MPTVEFGRINRRTSSPNLALRPFREDMIALASAGQTELRASVRDVEFIAADLTITSDGDFLAGLLGFAEDETLREFEDDSHSWLKGATQDVHGATRQTVVPFAVDLRAERRWLAHATTSRIRSTLFRKAFGAALNNAVASLRLIPIDWEVDPVMSVTALQDWIEEHPDVFRIRRQVKLTNPLSDVDEARRKMRQLGATTYRDEMVAPRGAALNVDSAGFGEHIEPITTGDAEVELEARGAGASGKNVYRSSSHRERTVIPRYGADLQAGVHAVLAVLIAYSERRGDVSHDEG